MSLALQELRAIIRHKDDREREVLGHIWYKRWIDKLESDCCISKHVLHHYISGEQMKKDFLHQQTMKFSEKISELSVDVNEIPGLMGEHFELNADIIRAKPRKKYENSYPKYGPFEHYAYS